MTQDQKKRIFQIEKTEMITEEDRQEFPGLHWCPDWDFLLVSKICMAEWECCLCDK